MIISKLLLWTWYIRHKIIFPKQLALGVFFLNRLGNKPYCERLQESLANLPDGTVGKSLWLMLHKQQLSLVPYYERHDLKHVILGYSTEASDEMRMQAFMFGNAGFSPFITLVFASFVIWTPEVWLELPYHYRLGKDTPSIADWRIEDLAHRNLRELRESLGLEQHQV